MQFKLPDLGEDIEEGQVVDVLVSEGDEVEADQPIISIETDKATVEVPSPQAGRISKLHASEGDTLKIGDPIATIETSEDGGEEDDEKEEKDQERKAKAQKKSKKKTGKKKKAGKPTKSERDEAEERKADEEEDDEEEGDDEEQRDEDDREEEAAQEEDEEDGEQEDETREDEEAETEEGTEEEADEGGERPRRKKAAKKDRKRKQDEGGADEEGGDEDQPPASPVTGGVPVYAAPSVRQLARELGVDLEQVTGSGPDGRIDPQDLKDHVRQQMSDERGRAGFTAPPPLPDFSQWGEVERRDMTRVRSATAKRMVASWHTIPHVTLFEKADATDFEQSRQDLKPRAQEQGVKLTVTAMLVKVVAAALRAHPVLATSVDMSKRQSIHKDYAHVAVAVDTEHGLVAPVIRDADQHNVLELAKQLAGLAEKARNRELTMDDMTGGVITVTNLGGFGTGFFTPIVTTPQTAVLGVGRAATEPVFDEERKKFVPRLMLPLSLAFDHRAMDGADAAAALHWIVQAIEQPMLLAMEG